MFCGNCGKKNEDGARFCEFCGKPLISEPEGQGQDPAQPFTEQEQREPAESEGAVQRQQIQQRQEGEMVRPAQQNPPPKKKRKRWIWGIAAAAVLIIALIIAGTLIFRDRQEKQRYQDALASGNRYLEEMDYEKAEDAYLEAISIDPKQKEPYLGLVDTYVAMEDYDRAVETAEEAKEILPEEDQQEFDEIIEKWEGAYSNIYQAYFDKLSELSQTYGEVGYISVPLGDEYFIEENQYLTGLCFATLLDFDVDGTEELVVVYRDPEVNSDDSAAQNYTVEIWDYQEARLINIYKGKAIGDMEHGIALYIEERDGKYYIREVEEVVQELDAASGETKTGMIVSDIGFTDKGFEVAATRESMQYISLELEIRDVYKINGDEVSQEEYYEECGKWNAAYSWGFQNGGDMTTTVEALTTTYETLANALGIEWEKDFSEIIPDSSEDDLIGLWENQQSEAYAMMAELTLYEDGTVGLLERHGFYWGTYETEEDGTVLIYLTDAALYGNSTAEWTGYKMDCCIQLTDGDNVQQKIFSQIYDNTNDHWLGDAEIVLTKINDTSADYSSVNNVVPEYKAKISQ